MNLGVFTEYISAATIEELAFNIGEMNLRSVVLSSYPGLDIDFDRPSKEHCHRIKTAFAQAGIEIAAVSGYSNLLHPDENARKTIHRRFVGSMRLCEGIGASMLCSETGTFHPKNEWEWSPDNVTEQAMEQLVESIRPLAVEAGKHGINLGFEPYVMNVVHSPRRADEFIRRLAMNNVKLVADPAGMLTASTLNTQATFLPDMFRYIAPHIGLVHVEDCRPDPEGHFQWLGAGEGEIDYPLFMELLIGSGYSGPLILEHLTEERIPESREFVRRQWIDATMRLGRSGYDD
ncbi:sugar phosphate isomerase/epimerase family protein [Cohnella herbarum]|uniref:Sugar phosphate isomerase/epimerase n=1 Tax=Cohnella herbarum TaxID=2728023 RepID=A0A7Z2VQA9_9BACL|nr:sugar phosphate isomerase/epimerase [Cohnella herbarum]QJD87145.1 sugar phosphate isomerase/epimerase [Cohnella herbarum]